MEVLASGSSHLENCGGSWEWLASAVSGFLTVDHSKTFRMKLLKEKVVTPSRMKSWRINIQKTGYAFAGLDPRRYRWEIEAMLHKTLDRGRPHLHCSRP